MKLKKNQYVWPNTTDIGAEVAAYKGVAGGYPALDQAGKVPLSQIPTGTSGSTVALGNDARFSDARTPVAHQHAAGDITSGLLAIARIPTGTTSSTVTLGNDGRLSDERAPLASLANVANGWVRLGADGKLPTSVLPALAINDTFPVASQAAMLALTAERGDLAIRTDVSKTFVLSAEPASTLANWLELPSGTGGVTSVNGQTGVVNLSAANVGASAATHASNHSPGGSDALSGYADTTTNQSIGGQKTVPAGAGNQWIFNQPPQVAVGSLVSHPVRRDDARLTDARTPTVHASTHSPGGTDDISGAYEPRTAKGAASGYASLDSNGRLPLAQMSSHGHLVGTTVTSYPYAASVAVACNTGVHFRIGTLTGNITLAEPTSPTDTQRILVELPADGSARTVSLNSIFEKLSGVDAILTVPANKIGFLTAVYSSVRNKWTVMGWDVLA